MSIVDEPEFPGQAERESDRSDGLIPYEVNAALQRKREPGWYLTHLRDFRDRLTCKRFRYLPSRQQEET